jgi:hypothetical protein
VDDLFEDIKNPGPYRVALPLVNSPKDQYLVRWWLQDSGWIEFQDWLIGYQNPAGIYEVWFRELSKATYFKMSFFL